MGKYSLGPFLPVPGTYPGIQGSKNGYFLAKSGPNGSGWLQARPVHLGRGLMCHITSQLMGKYSLGPFLPVPGTYPGIQGSKNGYFLAKSRPNGPGWLQARPVHLDLDDFNCTYKTYSLSHFTLCQYASC